MAFPSRSCWKISVDKHKEQKNYLHPEIRHLNIHIQMGGWGALMGLLLSALTHHAVQTEDEADEALQGQVTRGGSVTHGHQVEHVIAGI